MNNRMRARAKAHMPMVLLTLLSIIQALALELTWQHVLESGYLFQPTWVAALSWMQILTTLLGILLIWLVYSSMVMRFRWVPSTSNSVFPFVIGINEFILIATLGPERLAWWFGTLAVLFAITRWSIQLIMRQARLDGENDAFFATVSPATLRDFLPTFAICGSLGAIALALGISGHRGVFAMAAILIAAGAISYQLLLNGRFWRRSMEPAQGR
ncbi:MAG: hypothetical protein ACNA7W_02330 [Pseudomonadales bacterium]